MSEWGRTLTSLTTDSTRTLFTSNESGAATMRRTGVPSQCAAQAAAAQVRQGTTGTGRQQPLGGSAEDRGDIPHVVDARPILPLAAFFMGDLRDGLPMVSLFGCLSSTCIPLYPDCAQTLMNWFVLNICRHSAFPPFQLNMQAAFLISAKGFNEKQVGILFFGASWILA
jgi:hypothetical protein